LRELRLELALLNHRVCRRADLKDVELDCLDLIAKQGPLSPSVLARQMGLHPATMTGILDRLERGGWLTRERDPSDRRGVVVQIVGGRNAALLRHYSAMNSAIDQICADYSESELKLVVGFLRRVASAGRKAGDLLDQV
jgi:DNA-binding MarR family transcriptional regulator